MPNDAEIEAAARMMCRQNNGNPDLHHGGPETNSRPDWMKYRRKAERVLIAAEEARKQKPKKCRHPVQMRDKYDEDAYWTCSLCGGAFATRDDKAPLMKEAKNLLARNAAVTDQPDHAEA
jgi:rubrerythrin